MVTASVLAALILGGFGWWFVRARKVEASATWDDARSVYDPVRLAELRGLYAEMVQRIRAVRPDAVIAPDCRVSLMTHPGPFPKPYVGRWGQVLAPTADFTAGRCIVLASQLHNDALWRHEFVHCITGISDHPDWVFGGGLSLNV